MARAISSFTLAGRAPSPIAAWLSAPYPWYTPGMAALRRRPAGISSSTVSRAVVTRTSSLVVVCSSRAMVGSGDHSTPPPRTPPRTPSRRCCPMSTVDQDLDVPAGTAHLTPAAGDAEVTSARLARVGDIEVRRLLPLRKRRSVGAWCFVDHYGPESVDGVAGMQVPPHPHIGLQTVTWLIEGTVLHRDSLGSEQLIRPGQLNLMTAGHGIA